MSSLKLFNFLLIFIKIKIVAEEHEISSELVVDLLQIVCAHVREEFPLRVQACAQQTYNDKRGDVRT